MTDASKYIDSDRESEGVDRYKNVLRVHPEEESTDSSIPIGCSATQSLSFLLQTSEDQAMHVMVAAIQLDLVTSSTQHESTWEPTRPDRTQPRFPTGMACCGVAEVALHGTGDNT